MSGGVHLKFGFGGARTRARVVAIAALALSLASVLSWSLANASEGACSTDEFREAHYAVCRFDPAAADIRLFLKDESGAPFGGFAPLAETLEREGAELAFAMNAGMYHSDLAPVGLYRERGVEHVAINRNPGPGNFHMLPNGVFFVDGDRAGVLETESFILSARAPAFASQSGPMLVIDGDIHPRFLPDSTSRKRRNGVGVTRDGAIIFAIADSPVNFYDFAHFFRDVQKTPNALYFDGTISRLYAPSLARDDMGIAIGPIVGVVETK